MKELLDLWIGRKGFRGKLDEAKLRSAWKHLMGEQIAAHTESLRLEKGELLIRVDSPVIRQELSYSRQRIKDLLNEALGENFVESVRIG